jgi:hypothetical protein
LKKSENINNFKGINTLKHPTGLDNSEFPVLENFELMSFGGADKLTKRNGYERYNANQAGDAAKPLGTLFEAGFSAGDKLLINQEDGGSSQLYEVASPYTADPTAITGANGSNHAYRLSMAMLKDKVYIGNKGGGTAVNNVYNGTPASGYLDMGCPPCDTRDCTLTPSNGAGSLISAVFYYYIIIFLYDGFQKGGIVDVNFVLMGATDDTVTITNIPVSPSSRCTARLIYRSKPNTVNAYHLLTTIGNNTSTTYTDLTADTALGDAIDLEWFFDLKRPNISKYLTTHKDRLWLANLKDNLFNAMVSGDITLTPSNGAGSLDTGVVYGYKFYKLYQVGQNPTLYYVSEALQKDVTMGVADDTVTIHYAGTDPFVKYIAIERTSGGGTDYLLLGTAGGADSLLWDTAADYVDLRADASRSTEGVGWYVAGMTTQSLTYPSHVAFSDASKPDIFPSGNVIKIGENDGEEITGIFGEEDAVVVFKENSIHKILTHYQSTDFWRATPVVSNVGSDSFSQVQITDGHYVFIKSQQLGNGKLTIYEWTGGKPINCSLKIQKFIDDNRFKTIRGMVYDKHKQQVIILLTNTATKNDTIIRYNLAIRDETGLGTWNIDCNATTNLDLRSVCSTKDYGILYGSGIGYLNYQASSYQDSIGATPTNTPFASKVRTKTFEYDHANLRPRRFMIRMEVFSGTATGDAVTLVYKVDDITAGSESLSLTNSKAEQRLKNILFTDNDTNNTTRKNVYFEVQDGTILGTRILSMQADIDIEHESDPV